MTRRKTVWWSRLVATSPARFLKEPSGDQLLHVLTDWWMAGEGITDGTSGTVEHGARAVAQRYGQAAFYRRLAQVQFPALIDQDEHAVDAVHRAFENWAMSRKARKLIVSVDADAQARREIAEASRRQVELDVQIDVQDAVHHSVHHHVHQQVHHQVHQHVHHQVHHAISHAAHDSGSSGHGGGGGHGGH